MKVKIDIGPLSNYTGKLGGVPFENGVSLREVTPKEARKIGINVRIVDAETGVQVGTRFAADVGAVPATPLFQADETPEPPKVEEIEDVVEEVVNNCEKTYTKEELEAIAEEDGIRGIREVAKLFGVKGVQISQLIAGILAAQPQAE